LNELENSPGSALSILATRMPLASTFFITYVLLQGLTGSAQMILNIVGLVMYHLSKKLFASTPRTVWNLTAKLPPIYWGVMFPPVVLVFATGITYSTIAPLILPYVAIFFLLYRMCYRYMFLYVYDNNSYSNTHGRAFYTAVLHTFVGFYIFLLTMLGICILKQVIGPTILVFLGLIMTIVFNRYFDGKYSHLFRYIPVEEFDRTEGAPPAAPATASVDHVDDHSSEEHGRSQVSTPGVDIASIVTMVDRDDIAIRYLPPEMRKPTPLIWIPRDEDGRAVAKVQSFAQDGISVSCAGAEWENKEIVINNDQVPLKEEELLA